jgi:anti-sigma factor RsiW
MAAAIAAGVIAALVLPEWLMPSMMEHHETMPRPVIDYVAERHSRPLPVEVTGPDSGAVSMWFRDKVDFAVRPPTFPAGQVQLVGGRISNVGDQQAAHLIYDHHGRPITVVVFPDGAGIPIGGVQRQAGNHTVHVGQSRGFNVAVWRQGGVSYAVSSDLDQSDMIRLVSSVL